MAELTIDLPEALREFVAAKVAAGGYRDAGAFVTDLLRLCQKRDALEQQLIAAVDSGDFEDVTPAFWDRLRAQAKERSETEP